MAGASNVLSIVIKAKDEFSKTFGNLNGGMDKVKKGTMIAGAALTGMGAAAGAALGKARSEATTYASGITQVQRLTGMSAEESGKFAAVLDRMGVSGNGTTTIVKKLATSIVKASEGAAGGLNEMGIASTDANGKLRSSTDVLRDVADYYANAEDKTKAAALASGVLGKGYGSLLPILTGGSKAMDKIAVSAEKQGRILSQDALDASKKYAGAMKDNAGAVKGMQIQLGLMTLPAETFKAEMMGNVLETLNKLPGPMKNAAGTTMLVAEGLGKFVGPVLMALPGLTMLIPMIQNLALVTKLQAAAQWLMNAAMSANPIGLIIIAIVAVIAVFVLLWNKCDWFRAGIIGIWTAIKNATVAVWNGIVLAFKKYGLYIAAAILGPLVLLVVAIVKNWDKIKKVLAVAMSAVGNILKKGWQLALKAFSYSPLGLIIKNWDKIRGAIVGVVNRIVQAFKDMPGKVRAAFVRMLAVITGPLNAIITKLKDLNPFTRHSPSLVDNVLAGTGVIADAYSAISGMSIKPPVIGGMTPAFGLGSGSLGSRSSIGAQGPVQVAVYLDGRELNRGLAKTSSQVARSGVR